MNILKMRNKIDKGVNEPSEENGHNLRTFYRIKAFFFFKDQQADLPSKENALLLQYLPKNLYFLTDIQFFFYSIFKCFDII